MRKRAKSKSGLKAASREPVLPRPTEAETAILAVLWERGAGTVREVHEALEGARDVGYTTVLKLMQIMVEKGLVTRDESRRSHVYRPTAPPSTTRKQLVTDLVDRVFGGSTHKLMLEALGGNEVTEEELSAIRELVESMEKKTKQ